MPGLEAAGVVTEVAADVAGIAVGHKVIAQMRTGGYAEEAVVPAGAIRPMPEGFSFEEGATFLVAHMTAYHALKTRAGVTPGQTLLVLGAAGGVGLAGVQIGKVLGARVIAAASIAREAGGGGPARRGRCDRLQRGEGRGRREAPDVRRRRRRGARSGRHRAGGGAAVPRPGTASC